MPPGALVIKALLVFQLSVAFTVMVAGERSQQRPAPIPSSGEVVIVDHTPTLPSEILLAGTFKPEYWPLYGLCLCITGFWLTRPLSKKPRIRIRAALTVFCLTPTPNVYMFHGSDNDIYSFGFYSVLLIYKSISIAAFDANYLIYLVVVLLGAIPAVLLAWGVYVLSSVLLKRFEASKVSHVQYAGSLLVAASLLYFLEVTVPKMDLAVMTAYRPPPPDIHPTISTSNNGEESIQPVKNKSTNRSDFIRNPNDLESAIFTPIEPVNTDSEQDKVKQEQKLQTTNDGGSE